MASPSSLKLRLACPGEPGERDCFKSCPGDGAAGHFADAISSGFDSCEGLVDFQQGVGSLGDQRKNQITIASIVTGVGAIFCQVSPIDPISARFPGNAANRI